MNTPKKLFAFKLADRQDEKAKKEKWSVRDGVAIAGCTAGPTPLPYLPGPTPLSDLPYTC